MSAKEYLMSVGIIDAKVKIIEANIKKIRRELYEIGDIGVSSPWPDGQPHGTAMGDPTGAKATKLADSINAKRDELKNKLLELEYEQVQLHSALWSRRMDVLNTIEKIFSADEPITKTYYILLTERYIDGKTWEQIAVDIGYTIRHVWRLHGEALNRMEMILNE